MLHTKLQLCKPKTIGEMINVARKIALAEGSAQEMQYKKKDKYTEAFPQDQRGKNRTRKTETFTSLNTTKENLVTIVKEKLRVPESAPTRTLNIPLETSQSSAISIKIFATLLKTAYNWNEQSRD